MFLPPRREINSMEVLEFPRIDDLRWQVMVIASRVKRELSPSLVDTRSMACFILGVVAFAYVDFRTH